MSIDNSLKTPATQALQKLRLFTAIKTPYTESGKIDLEAFDAHAQTQIDNGVEGFVIGGTTGEGHLFNWAEHIMLIAHTKAVFGDSCSVVGNVGSNNTSEANYAADQGFAVGMDAALHINPYYGKTSTAGILHHLTQCLEHGPTIIYNVPGRTAQDIPISTMMELAEHKNFAGVKECMGRERIQAYSDVGIITWSGNDDEAHEVRHEAGCQGVISVTANLVPGLFSKMMTGECPDVAIQVVFQTLRNVLYQRSLCPLTSGNGAGRACAVQGLDRLALCRAQPYRCEHDDDASEWQSAFNPTRLACCPVRFATDDLGYDSTAAGHLPAGLPAALLPGINSHFIPSRSVLYPVV
eukprot:COSAG05_NODE_91_length_19902_cov_59.347523_2_plen_352_part_00